MLTFAAYPLISIDPEIRFSRACIIGTRIAVADVLGWLGNGMSVAEILEAFPQLTEEQIRACLLFAANSACPLGPSPQNA